MKQIGISGSWRYAHSKLTYDLKVEIAKILNRGDSIVTGGALGVDYLATQEVLKQRVKRPPITIYLPTTLEIYARHYLNKANQGIISRAMAEKLIKQLRTVKKLNPAALIENKRYKIVGQTSYYARNKQIAMACDQLLAFQVNKSAGTQNTIDETRKLGKKVKVYSYEVD